MAEEAEQIIASRKKKFHDATHHCYAYVTGPENPRFRYHDDGEPAGTAGKPILDAIQGRDLTQVVCVVTRYFGGTKLGTGGLVRAYGQCARDTLEAAEIAERFQKKRIHIRFPYDLTGKVMSVLSRYETSIRTKHYAEETEMEIDVKLSQSENFIRALIDGSGGQVVIQKQ